MSGNLGSKREREYEETENDDIGPLPTSATTCSSKRKGAENQMDWAVCIIHNYNITILPCAALAYEQVYLDNLPSAEMYERSYMHRDVITHTVATRLQLPPPL